MPLMGICEVVFAIKLQIIIRRFDMYHDEIFENALKDVKEENYKALKKEISTMEASIERFLKAIFESTSSRAERDFNISSI